MDGPLEASTGSGSIVADGIPSSGWTLQTDSGNIRLTPAAQAPFDLDAHTGSGTISIDQPITVQDTRTQQELRAKVKGGGTPVKVETASGDIMIL